MADFTVSRHFMATLGPHARRPPLAGAGVRALAPRLPSLASASRSRVGSLQKEGWWSEDGRLTTNDMNCQECFPTDGRRQTDLYQQELP